MMVSMHALIERAGKGIFYVNIRERGIYLNYSQLFVGSLDELLYQPKSFVTAQQSQATEFFEVSLTESLETNRLCVISTPIVMLFQSNQLLEKKNPICPIATCTFSILAWEYSCKSSSLYMIRALKIFGYGVNEYKNKMGDRSPKMKTICDPLGRNTDH